MSDTPDGFVIIHNPPDGRPTYGVGPFPPIKGLGEALIENALCDCDLAILVVAFPEGVTMTAHFDAESVINMANALRDAFEEREEPDAPHRLN